jgi:hypothetical protein
MELVEPVNTDDLVDILRDIAVGKKIPAWVHQTLKEEKGHVALVALSKIARDHRDIRAML